MCETKFPPLKQSFIYFFLNEVYCDFTLAYREQADLHTVTCYMTADGLQQLTYQLRHVNARAHVRTVHTQCFYASPRLLCPLGGFQSQTPRDRKWMVHRLDDPSNFVEICVQVTRGGFRDFCD